MTTSPTKAPRGRPKTLNRDHVLDTAMHAYCKEHDIRRKLKILAHAEETGHVAKTCRYWGMSRDTFYRWKRDYIAKGEAGLINSKPCPENPSIRVYPIIEKKILYLRKNYHFGPSKISWYLERYLELQVSMSGVYSVLKRNGMNRLPQNFFRSTSG